MVQFPYTSACLLAYMEEQQCKRRKKKLALLLLRWRTTCRTRNYLTTSALQAPEASPWYTLYLEGTDANLINQVGIGRSAFNCLLRAFSRFYVIRSGPGHRGRPAKLPDKHAVLAFLLQFYCSTMELKNLCLQFGVPPSTAARTLRSAEQALQHALCMVPDAKIIWPSFKEQREWASWIEIQEPIVTKKFAFIDGKNYRVLAPTAIDEQNALYNGWLHAALITGTLAFGADGCIIWGKHNCPGSWNDSETSRHFQEKLIDPRKTLEEYGVISDSAFPVSGYMYNKIVTPLKEGDLAQAVRQGASEAWLQMVHNALTSIRQSAEWGMGAVEKPFRRLLLPLPFDPYVQSLRLGNIHRLYNFRVRNTNISQIRNVFSL